jgi:hypothetical protein
MAQGFIYILTSQRCRSIKIGGTENPLLVRLAQINGDSTYASQGPWTILDFLRVRDWRHVERRLHRAFRPYQDVRIPSAREFFNVEAARAAIELQATPRELRPGIDAAAKLLKSHETRRYLHRLLQPTGLYGQLDLQGAWTLTIQSTATKAIRPPQYTINIGSHEVAFSRRTRSTTQFLHSLVVDPLLKDDGKAIDLILARNGYVGKVPYKGADRALHIQFTSSYAEAETVFGLPGVRRSLIAYWMDRLASLRERRTESTYARHHSYEAVGELNRYRFAWDATALKLLH